MESSGAALSCFMLSRETIFLQDVSLIKPEDPFNPLSEFKSCVKVEVAVLGFPS